MKYEKFGRRLGLNWLDLEKLAVLVAEWFHPKDTTLGPRISSMLDGVAEEVKIALRESNPSHPIAAECSDRDTALDFEDSKQILDCMLQSLASFRCQENVQVTHEKYKTSHLEDCICLNKVNSKYRQFSPKVGDKNNKINVRFIFQGFGIKRGS